MSREVFERTQVLLKAATQTTRGPTGRNPEYILRGLLRCARCGWAYTPAPTVKRNGTIYRYYRCVKRIKEGRAACPSSPLRAEAIEDYVIDRLTEAVQDGQLAAEITGGVTARIATRRDDIAIERRKLPPQIASLADDAARTIETMGGLTGTARRLVENRLNEVGDELTECEKRLAAIERELSSLAEIEVEASWIAECLADFGKVWAVLTPENRGRLVRAVVARVDVDQPGDTMSVFLTDLSSPVTAVEAVIGPAYVSQQAEAAS